MALLKNVEFTVRTVNSGPNNIGIYRHIVGFFTKTQTIDCHC